VGQKKPRPAMKLFLFILLISWGLLIAPALVNADGETRPPTREEKEFHKTVQTTIAQALPANGPTGWDEGNRSGIEELASIGIGEGVLNGGIALKPCVVLRLNEICSLHLV